MPQSKAEAYLDAVCAQIRWNKWKVAVREELAGHIEDRIIYLMEERGFSAEEAEQTAVENMGDPYELGKLLDAEHRPFQLYFLFLLTAIFWCAILFVAMKLLLALGIF